jgi:hypothetical protein
VLSTLLGKQFVSRLISLGHLTHEMRSYYAWPGMLGKRQAPQRAATHAVAILGALASCSALALEPEPIVKANGGLARCANAVSSRSAGFCMLCNSSPSVVSTVHLWAASLLGWYNRLSCCPLTHALGDARLDDISRCCT